MLRTQLLATLQAVHRTGSFALAARDLGYTPSAVSQQIAALEKYTGLVLFEREARAVRATAAAHRLVDLSRPVLAALDELETQVHHLATGTSGQIRLGSFPTGNVRLVPRVLSRFAQHAPGVEVRLDEGEPDDLADALTVGDLDVALLYEYGLCPRSWPDDLALEPLLQEDLLLLRPAEGHLPRDLPRLAGHSWITSAEGTAGARSLARLCAPAGFEPAILFRSNNYDVVRELVATTGSVAVVPAFGHRDDDRISATPLRENGAHRIVTAAFRRGNSNPALGEFLAAVRGVMRGGVPYVASLI